MPDFKGNVTLFIFNLFSNEDLKVLKKNYCSLEVCTLLYWFLKKDDVTYFTYCLLFHHCLLFLLMANKNYIITKSNGE